ncbi:MAG: hydantoinase/oxoprolinase family protein [Spirosomataceae bacterium]
MTKIEGIELHNPTLAIETVAAGGGSICCFDGQKLCVGPESAGASPGPACYGADGPLTITDINLLLGKLDTTQFGIPVSIDKAQDASRSFKIKWSSYQKVIFEEELQRV